MVSRSGLLAAGVLIGAAPVPPAPEQVPIGAFRTWGVHRTEALHIVSGGMRIDVVATPCAPVPQNEGCRYEGGSNQATVTVTRVGRRPFTMTSDRQSSFVRVSALRLTRDPASIGVVVDNQWGGSSGLTMASVVEPTASGYRLVPLVRSAAEPLLEGELSGRTIRRLADGRLAFVLLDPAFDSVFGCNACTPRPPVVLTIRDGRSVDSSADVAAREVFAADLAPRRAECLSTREGRDGSCAAFVADAARAGRLMPAWRAMLVHYQHVAADMLWQPCDLPYAQRPNGVCPAGHGTRYATFPASLRAFLVRVGYVTPRAAAALPLS